MIDAAVSELEGSGEGAGDVCVDGRSAERVVSGWLNSSGPTAFNAVHDHGL